MKHNLTNLLINIFFALGEAQDRLLSEIEYRLKYIEGGEMKHEIKRAHTMMMQSVDAFHKRYDLFMDAAKIDCLKDISDYDKSREDGYEFLRFLITYADRCNTPAKTKRLMEWLHYLPANVAPDEYIDKFTLK